MSDMLFVQSYENRKNLEKGTGFGKLRLLRFTIGTETAAYVPLKQMATPMSDTMILHDLFARSLLCYGLDLFIDGKSFRLSQ
jgi:hypothetical protein